MITALLFLIILLILVVIHEFGHFTAAKKLGIYVEEFGFGFPPRLFGYKWKETLYSINALPLGGFVRLFGEENTEEIAKAKGKISPQRAFITRPPWQKTLVIVAGVVMNFVLGWAIITYLFVQGTPTPSGVIITGIQQGSPAQSAGLMPKDLILRIARGKSITQVQIVDDVTGAAYQYAGQPVQMIIQRGTSILSKTITPRSNPSAGKGALGVTIQQKVEISKYPIYSAPWYGLIYASETTYRILSQILKIPYQLLTRHSTNVAFTGPVGIAKIVGEARKYGLNAILEITSILSLNLAVINILPFPALDGGRLVFVIYEWISGKRAHENLERTLNFAGIITLISLSILLTLKDVIRLW